jgi:hypothetical protein
MTGSEVLIVVTLVEFVPFPSGVTGGRDGPVGPTVLAVVVVVVCEVVVVIPPPGAPGVVVGTLLLIARCSVTPDCVSPATRV